MGTRETEIEDSYNTIYAERGKDIEEWPVSKYHTGRAPDLVVGCQLKCLHSTPEQPGSISASTHNARFLLKDTRGSSRAWRK